jgi:hypothetical protein
VDLSGSLDGSVGVGYFESASSGMLLCLFGGSETVSKMVVGVRLAVGYLYIYIYYLLPRLIDLSSRLKDLANQPIEQFIKSAQPINQTAHQVNPTRATVRAICPCHSNLVIFL